MIIKNKKGHVGWMISNWNEKGVFAFQQVEVISCGKIRMALFDKKSGDNLGNHFKPDMPLYVDAATAHNAAVDAANKFIENRVAFLRKVLARENNTAGYDAQIADDLAHFENVKGTACERIELLA